MSEGQRRLAAIMFTDIVGYTALTQKDEKHALDLLEKHRRLVRPILSQHNGREIKTIGDSFLIEFASALDATECATDIQKALRAENLKDPGSVKVRIGVHVGDIVHTGADVYGDAVNIASRIEPLAEPGGVCISEQVFAQVRNKVPCKFEKMPAHSLKNVEYPVETYRVVMASEENTSESTSPKNRVAVLPLSNISPDPRDSYFADGMTEELITVLSHVQGLRVIARTSVDRYKGVKDRGVAQIGRELGVGSMIEGSVRIAGDRLRVTVQLVDASNEEHLWSENYDRRLDDIFAVQSDIAKQVAENLQVKLFPRDEEKMTRRGSTNMTAYKSYLKGRALLARRNPGEMIEAKQLFEKTIAEDPLYAPAHAGLADTFYLLGDYWAMPVDQARIKAYEYIQKALKLDPDLPEARASLGLHLACEYRFKEAVAEYKRAIDLNPSYATAHMWYSQCLGSLRRYNEEQEELEIAEQLDPLSTVILFNIGTSYALLGKKNVAWEKIEKLSKLVPNSPRELTAKAIYYGQIGEPRKGVEEILRHPEHSDDFSVKASLAINTAAAGDKADAFKLLDEMLKAPDTTAYKDMFASFFYMALEDWDQYFFWANRAVDKKQFGFDNLELIPEIKLVTNDPRWKALLKRANLEQ